MQAATNPHEDGARLIKAIALADLLDAARIRSRRAATMDANEWALLAVAARVNEPSLTTRQAVISMLEGRERARKALAGIRRSSRAQTFVLNQRGSQ
jgi:hypothetical protein